MRKLTLSLELSGHGWLDAELAADGQAISMFASYLSDGLDALARSVVALLLGADRATFAWQEEPGEYRWIITRRDDRLCVRIAWFGQTFSRQPDDTGQIRFEAECELLWLATQVRGQMQRMLNELGPDGYRDRWRHEFPTSSFEQLKQLIAARKSAR